MKNCNWKTWAWTFEHNGRKRLYHLPKYPDCNCGHTSPLFLGYSEGFTQIKRPKHEACHSPSYNAEIKNELGYTSTSSYAVMYCTGESSTSCIRNRRFSIDLLRSQWVCLKITVCELTYVYGRAVWLQATIVTSERKLLCVATFVT
jgi:hypothetical protein